MEHSEQNGIPISALVENAPPVRVVLVQVANSKLLISDDAQHTLLSVRHSDRHRKAAAFRAVHEACKRSLSTVECDQMELPRDKQAKQRRP